MPLRAPLERRWLHYAFLSRDSGQSVIANLSALGPDGDGHAPHRTTILLVHDREHGWHSSQFNADRPDHPWSSFRSPHAIGVAGDFDVAARTGVPAVKLRLRRTGRPCTSQSAAFGGGEHLRWQSEPGVLASGLVRLPGIERDVELLGYHERVRGRWSWPALGGWVFGFVNDPVGRSDEPPPTAVVFTLIQSRDPRAAASGSVMLWRRGRLVRHFPRRAFQVAVHDVLDRDQVVLVPPLARALGTAPAASVPRRLLITARSGSDRLLLDFRGSTAARIANPCETGLPAFSVHETLGACHVEGVVAGRRLDFQAPGIVEFAGGTGDADDH